MPSLRRAASAPFVVAAVATIVVGVGGVAAFGAVRPAALAATAAGHHAASRPLRPGRATGTVVAGVVGGVVFHDADTGRWIPCVGLPGCATLHAYGNPATGHSEAVFRFKAGTPFAPHYHTSPEHVVGIAGIMEWRVGGVPHYLGPGDFLYYPSKAVHSGRCSPGADCMFYVYDDLPYDIHPAR
jgi:quercetin dioxygenase-like cupin family protein